MCRRGAPLVERELNALQCLVQLFKESDERTRGVWIADLLPHDAAPNVAAMIEQGIAAMKRVFG